MHSEKPQQPPLDLQGKPKLKLAQVPETAIFRPIHYLGSKFRLASAIADALDQADPTRGAVLDLFAGSGTTTLALAGRRRVIAADIQEYSRVICSALLSARTDISDSVSIFKERLQSGPPLLELLRHATQPLIQFEREALLAAKSGETEAICSVLEHGSILAAERGYFSGVSPELRSRLEDVTKRLKRAGLTGSPLATAVRYFGGAYFSYAQAVDLDCIAALMHEIEPCGSTDVFMAALMSTASDVVNTVGKQFAQPIRPKDKHGAIKKHLMPKIDRDRHLDTQQTYLTWLERYAFYVAPGSGHVAARLDYRDALTQFAGQYAVVYADPPYTRDHYSRFYHVLETMARRDNPTIARNPGADDHKLSRGLYRDDRHQSPFCIRSQAPLAFRDLFRLASQTGAQMVLSYSPFQSGAHPRLMQIDALLAIAREFYASVELDCIDGVSHSKLNHSKLNLHIPTEAEVLIVCKLK